MSYTVKGAPADPEQIKTIDAALAQARSMGAGYRTMVCCVMTMTQESSCQELTYGDLDSLGPYQQRATWGPAPMRINASSSTRLFLDGGETGEPGFRAYYSLPDGPPSDVPLDEACQRVQVSAFPYAYGQWEAEAERNVSAWLAAQKPPKTMHYERYPKSWRTAVKRYDALRTKEHFGTLTRIEGLWLAHRRAQCRQYATYTYRKAVRDGSLRQPNWDPRVHRGWLEQQLLRRAKGLRAFPTE